jgi:hypothetical protein
MGIWRWFSSWAERNVGTAGEPDEIVVKTTRFLRMAMIGLITGLGVSVLYEYAKTHPAGGGHCWQESISAYYYTPAQSFFVGALITIGIGMIVLKGSTEIEDVLLNFAGFFAPLVAFVPTARNDSCGSALTDTADRNLDLNIGNNVTALLVMAGLAFLFMLYLQLKPDRWAPRQLDPDGTVAGRRPLGVISKASYLLTLALYVLVWVVFLAKRSWFIDHGHDVAAITMFVFIFLVVVDNATNLHFTHKAEHSQLHRINRYSYIAIAMVVASLIVAALKLFGHFAYSVIWIEAIMITLFGIFWVMQTFELWSQGLRQPTNRPAPDPAPPVRTE